MNSKAVSLALFLVLIQAVCSPARAQLTNGSFETGDFTGWSTSMTGAPFIPWLVSPAGNGAGFGMQSTAPEDGMFDAWNGFDGGGPMDFFMSQDFSVPAAPVTLSWKDRIQWNFALTRTATQARTYDVSLIDPIANSVLATLYSFSTGTAIIIGDTGWQSHNADLSAFAGSTIRLQFHEAVPEPFTGPGQLEIDDVRPSFPTPAAVPEPGTLCLLVSPAVAGLLVLRRQARR